MIQIRRNIPIPVQLQKFTFRCLRPFSSNPYPIDPKPIKYFDLPPHLLWDKVASIDRFSQKPISPLTLRKLVRTNGKTNDAIIRIAEWIRTELTVRFAHRLYDFHHLPFFALAIPPIRQTYEIYIRTFEGLQTSDPIKSLEDEKFFVDFIEKEKLLHDKTVEAMALGVKRLNYISSKINLNPFLQRFFFFRIGRTVLIDHLIAMRQPMKGWIGCINLECRPADIIRNVAEETRQSCRNSYGIAPRVHIGGNTSTHFAFLPHHLALIIGEILKNALRATVEFHTLTHSLNPSPNFICDESELPEVNIEVYKGNKDVLIKISDKGGGIVPHQIKRIWDFGFTTVDETCTPGSFWKSSVRPELAGYGFGCPLSLVFARYFGGDINIQSSFGVGTDVYISLNHIGDQEEALFYEERREVPKHPNSEFLVDNSLEINI